MCALACVECVKWERAIKLLLSERFHPMQAAAEEGKQDNVALLSCCCSCSCFRFVCLFHEMAPPHTHPQIHSPSHPPSTTTTTTTSSTCENYPANDCRWFGYALLSPAQLVDQLILPGGSLVGIALPDSFHVASQHRRRPYRPRRLVVRGLALCVTCKPALVKQSSVRSVTTEGDGLLILLLYIIVGI